jgi:hypothetical protein
MNGAPKTTGVYLFLFADDTCLYAIDRKEGFVVRKLQRGLSSMETWYERWNIKINEDNSQRIYFSRNRRPPKFQITLNRRNIQFVNNAKYIGVIFDKAVTWRLHAKIIKAKDFRIFIRRYSVLKSERLSANNKLTLHEALIRSMMTLLAPPGSLQQTTIYWNRSACKTKFSAPLKIFQGAHRFLICTWLSYFRI